VLVQRGRKEDLTNERTCYICVRTCGKWEGEDDSWRREAGMAVPANHSKIYLAAASSSLFPTGSQHLVSDPALPASRRPWEYQLTSLLAAPPTQGSVCVPIVE
jgi:hypothetical protein